VKSFSRSAEAGRLGDGGLGGVREAARDPLRPVVLMAMAWAMREELFGIS
jgi:hypothetical protein